MRGLADARVVGVIIIASLLGCEDGDVNLQMSSPQRTVIATNNAPAAVGPYSQAIQFGNTLYVAGQVGINLDGQLAEGIEAQARQAMQNIGAILSAAGYSFSDVVQVQVFLADLEEYGAMNDVYSSFFDVAPPARAAVQAARLPLDARVEIMVTAAK